MGEVQASILLTRADNVLRPLIHVTASAPETPGEGFLLQTPRGWRVARRSQSLLLALNAEGPTLYAQPH